jgi:hypothetical protein
VYADRSVCLGCVVEYAAAVRAYEACRAFPWPRHGRYTGLYVARREAAVALAELRAWRASNR